VAGLLLQSQCAADLLNRGSRRALQQHGIQQHGIQQQTRAVSCLQLTDVAGDRLVVIVHVSSYGSD